MKYITRFSVFILSLILECGRLGKASPGGVAPDEIFDN